MEWKLGNGLVITVTSLNRVVISPTVPWIKKGGYITGINWIKGFSIYSSFKVEEVNLKEDKELSVDEPFQSLDLGLSHVFLFMGMEVGGGSGWSNPGQELIKGLY